MAVDFKNKLFQKALWGYVPEEVDEYIAYVAGEYTRLEKRLAAIRAENAKKQGGTGSSRQADIPGVTGGEAPENPAGGSVEKAFAEGERILSEARTEAEQLRDAAASDAESVRSGAAEEAEKTLADAKSKAENLLAEARTGAETVLAEAKEEADRVRAEAEQGAAEIRDAAQAEREELLAGGRSDAENLLTDARAEAERIRAEAQSEVERILLEARAEAQAEAQAEARSEAEKIRSEAEEGAEAILAEARKSAEEEAGAALESARREAEAILAAAKRETAPESSVDKESEDPAAMREEARLQFEESGRILTGLRAASERFRRDLAAFSSSMQSLARTQLGAAERFGEDAERFLAEMDAYAGVEEKSGEADGAEDGDLFGFASAAAMIGDLLKDLPEDGDAGAQKTETVQEPDGTASAEDAPSDGTSDEADVLMAESAMAGHIEEEAGRLLAQLLELDESGPDNVPEKETPPDGDDIAGNLPDFSSDGVTETAPDFSPDGTEAIPGEEPPADPESSAETVNIDFADGAVHDAEPGDEELEAVMAALSGISEDDSYDAMLAAFHPEEEVDPRMAEDLAKKRRDKFRRMMEEAAGGQNADKGTGAASDNADGSVPDSAADSAPESSLTDTALEEEITAAVEAALRSDLDPEKALDEMLASLTADGTDIVPPDGTGTDPGMPALHTDVMALLDFEEPAGDGPAWTDHSLEEFVSSREEQENGEAPEPEDAG